MAEKHRILFFMGTIFNLVIQFLVQMVCVSGLAAYYYILLCGACVATKRVTDDEASRGFLLRQKLSREWSLLNNITWSEAGSSLADAVYGGFIIVTAGLLFGRIFGGSGSRAGSMAEKFLLITGAVLFIILGSLELASLDSIPENLLDNAAILGCLSLLVAALFILDAARRRSSLIVAGSQTEPATGYSRFDDVTDGIAQFTKFGSVRDEPQEKQHQQPLQQPHMVAVLPREPAPPKLEQVTSVTLPTKQSPVFSRVKTGERAVLNKQLCCENTISPTSPGFVQKAARQWEKAAKDRGRQPGSPTPC